MDEAEFIERLARLQEDQGTPEAFFKICGFYRKISPEERSLMRSLCDEKARRKWKIPSTVDFPRQDRLPAEERLRAALIYASIEDLRHDFRDTLVSLSATYHAARETGVDIVRLIEEVAALSSPEFAGFLRRFLARSPEDRSLAAFGLTDACTPERVTYRG